MTPWYDRWSAHIGLRLAGAALLASAWVEGGALHRLIGGPGGGAVSAVQLLLAALLFASASVGTMFTIIGPALWAPVTLSDRWAAVGPAER